MVYVVIPIKNRKEYTMKCLESFLNQDYPDIKVVVVDDGSDDNSREEILNKYPNVEVLKGSGDLWCMGSFAMGVDYIKPMLGENDYILTQNQDAYFDSSFVRNLVQVAQKNPNSIIGSINFSSKSNKVLYHDHILKGGVFRPHIIDGDVPEVITNCDTLNTRGTLFPASVFKKIDNFSKLFPHYAGDYEIACRAKKNGFNLLVSTKSVCYSWDDNKNLAVRIREKPKKSFKDLVDLFTSRRSPSNLYYSNLLVILHVPFPQKILGIARINAHAIKIIVFDYLFKSIILGWMN